LADVPVGAFLSGGLDSASVVALMNRSLGGRLKTFTVDFGESGFSEERKIPCYHFRHLVKPGITGWAQVNYPYGASIEDTARKLEYDLYSIRHFSFTLDAAIVLKTINTVIGGKGR
jgi:tRNA(Ile)-lysidine synthase TilS/MesJ